MTKDMEIRLDERIRIYRGSPQVQVTYEDLAQLIEVLLEISHSNKEIGFNGNKES